MAKQRMINTKFWSDNWVVELNPLERYLYLFLLTNEHTNIAGVYELPLRVMAFETGIDKEMLPKMLKHFRSRVMYKDGWVILKNFQKHQSSSSIKVQRGIEIEMEKLPEKIRKLAISEYPTDRVSKGIIYSNSNSNLNTNSNSNSNSKVNNSVSLSVEVTKNKFGEHENVLVSKEELDKLHQLMGEKNTDILIEELSDYLASTNKRYKSHYATLRSWARRKIQEQSKKTSYQQNKSTANFGG